MLYNEGSITVDRNFARFGSKSYAINKINTVDVRSSKPHGLGPVILFGILALLFASVAKTAAEAGGAEPFVGIAVICAGVAVWSWTKTKIVEYKLYLMTSSAETQALTTRDQEVVLALRDAIEIAMSTGQQHDVNVRFAPDGAPEPEMKRATPGRRGGLLASHD